MTDSMHFLDYAVMIAYMIIVLGIDFYFSRNEKNSEDYLLGGRNMPYIAIGLQLGNKANFCSPYHSSNVVASYIKKLTKHMA